MYVYVSIVYMLCSPMYVYVSSVYMLCSPMYVYVSIVYMLEGINNLFIYLSIQCLHVLGILNMVYFESPRVQLILKKNKAAKHLSFSQQRLG